MEREASHLLQLCEHMGEREGPAGGTAQLKNDGVFLSSLS